MLRHMTKPVMTAQLLSEGNLYTIFKITVIITLEEASRCGCTAHCPAQQRALDARPAYRFVLS